MEEEEEELDRISQLPDAILQHILSFIDIKLAVQTTILSTRWQNLWLSISDLNFKSTSLDFVSHFLTRRDPATTIHKLHLSLDSRTEVDAPSVEKCVDYAITHGVEALHLDAVCRSPLRLPASKTLRELELRKLSYGVYLPREVFLPHLKTLYLENTKFIEEGGQYYSYVKEPFSGFPELEKLTLHRYWISELVIFCPKLRVLVMIQTYDRVAEIWAPRLVSFRYEGSSPMGDTKLNFPVLEEMYMNIRPYRQLKSMWMALKCVQMLLQLGNANVVTLTLDTIEVLEMDRGLKERSPSPFPNMKRLRLTKGRRQIPTVLQRVMNYLTGSSGGDSLKVEIPEGVCVIEKEYFDAETDELQLERLFQIQDETFS